MPVQIQTKKNNEAYYIALDENNQPYIAHGWWNNTTKNAKAKTHKYIEKIGDRYFYTKEELEAYYRNTKSKASTALKSAGNAIKSKTDRIKDELSKSKDNKQTYIAGPIFGDKAGQKITIDDGSSKSKTKQGFDDYMHYTAQMRKRQSAVDRKADNIESGWKDLPNGGAQSVTVISSDEKERAKALRESAKNIEKDYDRKLEKLLKENLKDDEFIKQQSTLRHEYESQLGYIETELDSMWKEIDERENRWTDKVANAYSAREEENQKKHKEIRRELDNIRNEVKAAEKVAGKNSSNAKSQLDYIAKKDRCEKQILDYAKEALDRNIEAQRAVKAARSKSWTEMTDWDISCDADIKYTYKLINELKDYYEDTTGKTITLEKFEQLLNRR